MKSINVCIIGTNFISDRFAEAVIESGALNLFAVYSRSLDTGKAFADKYGIERVYNSLDKMLNDAEIDAVYVASPTFLHKDHSIAAIKAKKHVLCEKMIAVTHDEFSEMRALAKENGVVLLEAMRPDFDGSFDLIREALPKIGKIRRVSFDYCQYSSRYDKFKAGTVLNAFDPKMKNSALADIGIYPLHTCVLLFGEPRSVSSDSLFLENGFEGAGSVRLLYDGMIALINYSKIADNFSPSVIEGECGSIVIDTFNPPNKITVKLRSGEEYDLPYVKVKNNMIYEARAFADMVNGTRSEEPYLDVSDVTLRLVDKIYESSGITKSF